MNFIRQMENEHLAAQSQLAKQGAPMSLNQSLQNMAVAYFEAGSI